jgi:predicted acylesterase/phospholipase RssA
MLHDIPLDINLKDFYEKTNIDLHIFTTSVKELKAVDLNHCTFPTLSVIQAVSMSASVPLLFTPVLYEDEYYIDGGMLTHCPVSPYPHLSVVIMIDNVPPSTFDSAFEFIQHLLVKSLNIICSNTERPIGKHVFCFDSAKYGIDPVLWEKVLTIESFRNEMIEIGKNFIKEKYI